MPATANDLPFRLTRSPTDTPSASAKVRSITTPPGRTQLPAVSSGWSTADGASLRPSANTSAWRPSNRIVAEATGKGPLWFATPDAWLRLLAWAADVRYATTSGPFVAARVVRYGDRLVTPFKAIAIVSAAAAAAMATTSRVRPAVWRPSKSRSTSKVAALSRLPVGSSASTIRGSLASDRAIATRWR